MEITAFTIQIIIIGIPGILCYFIASKLIGKIGQNTIEAFLSIFLFSIFSYIFYSVFLSVFKLFNTSIQNDIINKIFTNQKSITYFDILGASIISILIAFTLSYFYRFNVLNRIGQKIGATFRYGDEDVWHYFHRAEDKNKNDGWIFVRDHKYNLVYYGAVTAWSESEKSRELILTEVTVFTNDEGIELYEADHIYLCRNIDDITIEVNNKQKEKDNNG